MTSPPTPLLQTEGRVISERILKFVKNLFQTGEQVKVEPSEIELTVTVQSLKRLQNLS
jgi:hypothetical protein